MFTRDVDTGLDRLGLKPTAPSRLYLDLRANKDLPMFAGHCARPMRCLSEAKFEPEFAILILLLLTPALSNAAELKSETLQAWNAYVCAAKMRMGERASGKAPFLWVDEDHDLSQQVRGGEVMVEPVDGESPHMVPRGLIHDWVGAIFVPHAKLDDVMGVLNDYPRYKDFYRPMVVNSQRLEQTPDHEKVSLLMMQKAFSVTAAVETEDEVQIVRVDANRAYSVSNSVRVQEIADYGKSSEHALPEDQGPGYIWRTFTLTRLEQRDDGVYEELEMIALSRGIPLMFRWLMQSLAERLPRSILSTMLEDTRDAVNQEIKAAALKTPSAGQVAP